MSCWKQFFLWLNSKNSRLTQLSVLSVLLLKLVWIKVKVRLQPFLFNKVLWMYKTLSLSEILSDVSVLWPMTLAVVLRLLGHLHRFPSLVWTKRHWLVITLPFTKMKNLLVQQVKNVLNVPFSNNVKQPNALVLKTSLILLKLGNSSQLTLSSRPTCKVLLKLSLPHFKRLMLKVWKLPLFTQPLVPSTSQT